LGVLAEGKKSQKKKGQKRKNGEKWADGGRQTFLPHAKRGSKKNSGDWSAFKIRRKDGRRGANLKGEGRKEEGLTSP